MFLRTTCALEFEIVEPTPFVFMLRFRRDGCQQVLHEEFSLSADIPVQEFTDTFGNVCQRVIAPPGLFEVRSSADVEPAPETDIDIYAPFVPIGELPVSAFPFLYPSRFVESDRFGAFTAIVVEDAASGYDQCARIVDHIRDTLRYAPGEGEFGISAWEAKDRPTGVCRDMAHLGIAMCRALAIPARYVVGYLEDLEPMDLHAWFEAYVGDGWHTFDPTQSSAVGARAVLGYGRDAADVAIYTQFGQYVPLLNMTVQAQRIDEDTGC